MSAKIAITLALLVGAVICDNSGYSAPVAQSGYSAPAAGYGAPTGAAPSYDASAPSYEAPGYDYSSGYEVADEGGFDLGKIEELLPLFLAVLAAIILAQLFTPLLSSLVVILVGILPMALEIKAPIVNALLGPFGLTLCSLNPTAVFPAGRSFEENFGLSEETSRALKDGLDTVFEMAKNHYGL